MTSNAAHSSSPRLASPTRFSQPASSRAVWLLLAAYLAIFFAASWYKYSHYGYGYDQVDFEQAVWATTQGRPFFDSRFNFTDSVFGMDFMPALGLFVPFYALVPSALTMAWGETVVIALGALPVYWLARAVIGGRWAGLTFASLYLLYPTIQYVNLFAFNLRPLGVTAILFALWFLHQRRWLPFVLCAAFALLARTDVALTVAALGLYALLTTKPLRAGLRFGLPVLLGGLLYFFVSLYLVVPAFTSPCTNSAATNQVQTAPAQAEDTSDSLQSSEPGGNGCGGRSNFLIGYYSHLGNSSSFGGVISYVATHPVEVAKLVFTAQKLKYLFWLLLPVLFLPLLRPVSWLLLAPTLALNLLTNRRSQLDYHSHYQMLLIPGLLVGAIYGFARLQGWLRAINLPPGTGEEQAHPPAARPLVLGSIVLLALAINFASGNPVYLAFRFGESEARVAAANALVASVPRGAGVAATSSLAPHLLPRWYIYNYPPATYSPYDRDYNFAATSSVAPASGKLDYILLDCSAAVLMVDKKLAPCAQPAIAALRADPRWQVAAEQERFVLFKRR